MLPSVSKKNSFYFNSKDPFALLSFSETLCKLIRSQCLDERPIIVFCIGTDRATGDSLGPIVGYKLDRTCPKHVQVCGTLKEPIHAKNLIDHLTALNTIYKNPFIIAIDACLGKVDHIGLVNVGEGPLVPGSGVRKTLPAVGDIYITGIVNFSGPADMLILQNTRLNTVMEMADFIVMGLRDTFFKIGKHGQFIPS